MVLEKRHSQKMIKKSAISLISYDAHLLPNSIKTYYDYVDEIVLGIDKDRISWSGNSFQIDEGGFEHQFDMPDVPGPNDLQSERELREAMIDEIPKEFRDGFLREKAVELRTVEQYSPMNSEKKPPYKHTWMKANGKLPDDILVHQNILAYASDFGLLSTAQLPHGISWGGMNRRVMSASIDHAMWFHRPFRADEWLLYVTDSPSASNAKGFNRGTVYTEDGKLVASAIQEGLMRQIKSKKN